MRIQLISDCHVEHHRDGGAGFIASLDAQDVDVLVVAGDLGLEENGSLQHALDLLCKKYAHVVFVIGNHELYHSSRTQVFKTMKTLVERHDNLHWLEDSTVTIEGQRFVGSTLWFQDQPDGLNHHYARGMNDKLIKSVYSWVYEVNEDSMKFLEETIQEGDVVITHYIPTIQGVHPRWRNTSKTSGRFFLCQMPYSVLWKPRYWFFGHTHDTMAFKAGNCEFRCNPLGYPGEDRPTHFINKLVMGEMDPIRCSVCGHKFEVPSDAIDLSPEEDIRCPECYSWAIEGI